MISARTRSLFDELASLDPLERRSRIDALRETPGLIDADLDEACALVAALDIAPGFLEWASTGTGDPLKSPQGLPLGPGRRLGTFTIVREVGRGGMGIVYEAMQDEPRRRVALKVMRAEGMSPVARTRFRREAEILGRLRHPGIAAVHEARVRTSPRDDDQPYIAMEYVDGVPITEFAEAHSLDTAGRVRLIEDAADAIQHAHEAGIVHRDISPSNLLVNAQGQVKVVDFGVARLAEAEAPASLVTIDNHVLGKWAYASPEQAVGNASGVDHRTDVFALGSVLYELLAGRPWLNTEGRMVFEVLRDIERDRPAPLPPLSCRRERDLREVVRVAMHKERSRRYPSAGTLRDELARWRRGERVLARPPSVADRARSFVAANKVLSASVAAAFAALSVGLGAATIQWSRARAAEQDVRQTVSIVLRDIVTALNRTQLSTELRASVLKELQPGIERLLGASPDDAEVRALAARYFSEVAVLEGYYFSVNRGNPASATDAFRKAVDIAAPQGIARVSNENAAFAAIEALNRLEEMRRLDAAMAAGEEQELHDALALCDRMFPAAANPLELLRLRTWTLGSLMERAAALGQTADLASLRADAHTAILRATPPDPTADQRGLLGQCWLTLIVPTVKVGLFEGVREECRFVRGFIDARIDAGHADPDDSLNLLDTYRYESKALAGLGRVEEALAVADDAVALARSIAEQFGHRTNVLSGIIVALQEQGTARARLGRLDAIDSINEAIDISMSRGGEQANAFTSIRKRLDLHLARAAAIRALQLAGLDKAADGRPLETLLHESLESIDRLAATDVLAPKVIAGFRDKVARLKADGPH